MLYNGITPFPERKLLKLSDSFEEVPGINKPGLELEVQVYNINTGYNKSLLGKNRDLSEYACFVDIVRRKKADAEDKEEAFRLAIKECIDNNILKEFLMKHMEKVLNSLLSISAEELYAIRMEESREEGLEEGLFKGRLEGLTQAKFETAQKMKKAGLSIEQIKKFTGLSPEEIENFDA